MNNELTLIFDGQLIKNNMISVRTISHTLPHLQRAIDKLVMYEHYGDVMKSSALSHVYYDEADLYFGSFEKGSIKIPFLSDLLESVPKNLNSFLVSPYEKAASKLESKLTKIPDQIENAKTNIYHHNVDEITHEQLIQDKSGSDRKHAEVAVLKDISNMLAPLRSARAFDDTITLRNNVSGKTREFLFDQEKSKNFSKIITNQNLAKPVIYTGKLNGLEKNGNSKMFPYAGTFNSAANEQDLRLLINSDLDMNLLKKHNLSHQTIAIWASPITTYRAFDHHRGDIAFVSLLK